MTTLEPNHPAEPDDSPNVMALGVLMAVLGSLAYVLLMWAAIQLAII